MEREQVLQRLRTMSDDDIRVAIEKCWMSYWQTHEKHWKVGAIALGKELMYRIARSQ
jgi:hypothetical protein